MNGPYISCTSVGQQSTESLFNRKVTRMRNAMTSTLALAAALLIGSATPASAQYNDMNEKNIVETAVEAGSFTTLATALEAAGLVETLANGGPFTVFAPTDEAFAKLPEGTLDALLQDKERLAAILTYHVVPGEVTAEQVVGIDSAETVNGREISITVVDGNVMINDATVTQTDIKASNGIIHVIDSVILPGN